MEIKIKSNSMTKAAYRKYAEKGVTANDIVKVSKVGGFAGVSVNGERIGNIVGMKYSEMPNSFQIQNMRFDGNGICTADLAEDNIFNISEEESPKQTAVKTEKKSVASGWQKEIINSMRENGVHESVIAAVSERWNDKQAGRKPNVVYRDVNGEVSSALISALCGNGTLLMGPKSTGKNVLMGTLAWYLNVPYWRMNLDQKSMPEDLYGSKTTDNSAAEELRKRSDLAQAYLRFRSGDDSYIEQAAQFEILKAEANSIHIIQQDSSFIKWARRGGLFNADEINLWPTDILVSGLNPVLDGEKTVSIESTGENISISDDAYFFGGMNPGYEGTVELNEAFQSRCNILILDYPDSVESQICANFGAMKTSSPHKASSVNAGFKAGHLPKGYIKACDNLFADFRRMVESGRVSDKIMNIRGIVRALKMVDAFPNAISLAEALNMSIVNGCEDDEQMIIRQCIADRIDF